MTRGGRDMRVRWLAVAAGALVTALLVRKEAPAVRRYVKMSRM